MNPVPYAGDVLSASRLRGAGFGSHTVAALVADGLLHRLCRGWYATRAPESAEDQHLLLAHAVLRRLAGRAALSHFSVVVASELPTWKADLQRVHVTRLDDQVTCRRPHLVSHARIRGLEPTSTAGLDPTVPLAVAIVQSGLVAGAMDAAIAADAALHRGLVTGAALDSAVLLLKGHRGLLATVAALSRRDGRHESPGETRLAHLLADLGIAATPQFQVETRLGTRWADFRIDRTRVLLEMDGKVKYTDPRRRGDVLWLEKRRQDAVEDEGWVVVRVSWADLDHPASLHPRISSAIARSNRLVC